MALCRVRPIFWAICYVIVFAVFPFIYQIDRDGFAQTSASPDSSLTGQLKEVSTIATNALRTAIGSNRVRATPPYSYKMLTLTVLPAK